MIDFIKFPKIDNKNKSEMLLKLLNLKLTYLLIPNLRKPLLLLKLIKNQKILFEIDQFRTSYTMMQLEDNLNRKDKKKQILIKKRKRKNQRSQTQILNILFTNLTENLNLFMSRYLEFVQKMNHKMNLSV